MKKIMVVDDEPAITRMVKLNLEETGLYEVMTENNGPHVIEVVREFMPDLIFLDIMMPEMTGDEIAETLKNDSELENIKVVFLTALVTRDETANGKNEIGTNQFLAKPVSTKDLLHCINEVLNEE